MTTGTLAKIFGWIGFVVTAIPSIVNQTGTHGFAQIAQALGALAIAIGIHAASASGPANK